LFDARNSPALAGSDKTGLPSVRRVKYYEAFAKGRTGEFEGAAPLTRHFVVFGETGI